MSAYVFTGPTISPAEAARELEAVYLPPAADGDVYRVTLKRPLAIGIIDGYFQSRPTIRHKEILWAMTKGVHVFGSSSIGALRASELAAFGMEGVGTIFESYRDGILEDDDEVAIVHGPAENGFVAGSEAMVNIRHTLLKAELTNIISTKSRMILEEIGKKLFYPDRNYQVLLRSAVDAGIPETELTRFRQWLPQGRVNQKREDALAMLRLMRRRLSDGLKPKKVSYSFEYTSTWETACHQFGNLRSDSMGDTSAIRLESLLDELRLEGEQYEHHILLTLRRFLAIREANRLGMSITSRRRSQAELAFRREHDLVDEAKLKAWMSENDLSDSEFDVLIDDEARVEWFHQRTGIMSVSYLPEQLRRSGDYSRLATRAVAKARLLDSLGLNFPSLKDANLTEGQLLRWYFEEILCRPVPENPNSYARKLGFTRREAFRRALLKEFLYRRFKDGTCQRLPSSAA
jgi:hypothetical protein